MPSKRRLESSQDADAKKAKGYETVECYCGRPLVLHMDCKDIQNPFPEAEVDMDHMLWMHQLECEDCGIVWSTEQLEDHGLKSVITKCQHKDHLIKLKFGLKFTLWECTECKLRFECTPEDDSADEPSESEEESDDANTCFVCEEKKYDCPCWDKYWSSACGGDCDRKVTVIKNIADSEMSMDQIENLMITLGETMPKDRLKKVIQRLKEFDDINSL